MKWRKNHTDTAAHFCTRWANHIAAHYSTGWWMDKLGFYVSLNAISVISGQWKGKHERLCAMKCCLGSGRNYPPEGFEPATLWSEVRSANRSAATASFYRMSQSYCSSLLYRMSQLHCSPLLYRMCQSYCSRLLYRMSQLYCSPLLYRMCQSYCSPLLYRMESYCNPLLYWMSQLYCSPLLYRMSQLYCSQLCTG